MCCSIADQSIVAGGGERTGGGASTGLVETTRPDASSSSIVRPCVRAAPWCPAAGSKR
jgi:hypothetical protein